MTFEEFKEKYKDVKIKEFFPLWGDGGVVGDIYHWWTLNGRQTHDVFRVRCINVDFFVITRSVPTDKVESSYFSEGYKTFKQLSEQYEQKQKQKEKFVNHANCKNNNRITSTLSRLQ